LGARIEAEKRAMRRAARLAARQAAASRSASAGRRAQERVLALPELAACQTVSLYAARPDEVPTARVFAALRRRGTRIALPRVAEPEIELHAVEALDEIGPGWRGIDEPAADAPSVAPEAVDLFVVPGLCFDRLGGRLGRGGGHYDRLLARARRSALRVGLCFDDQVVERIPTAEGDATMDVVVTPDELIRAER
jgi:5-formyltetrahydrofolate cyclo-ligase